MHTHTHKHACTHTHITQEWRRRWSQTRGRMRSCALYARPLRAGTPIWCCWSCSTSTASGRFRWLRFVVRSWTLPFLLSAVPALGLQETRLGRCCPASSMVSPQHPAGCRLTAPGCRTRAYAARGRNRYSAHIVAPLPFLAPLAGVLAAGEQPRPGAQPVPQVLQGKGAWVWSLVQRRAEPSRTSFTVSVLCKR